MVLPSLPDAPFRRAACLVRATPRAAEVRSALAVALAVGMIAMAGCEETPTVRVYDAPAYTVPATLAATGATTAAATAAGAAPASNVAANGRSGLRWTLPPGWTDTGESNEFRVATLVTGEGDDRVEVAVSRVPGQAGSIAANVNRWRGQLGLGPADREQVIADVDPAPTGDDGLPGMVVTIANAEASPPAAQRIAWFELSDGTWYLKATGTPAAVERQTPAFHTLLASLRPGGDSPNSYDPVP